MSNLRRSRLYLLTAVTCAALAALALIGRLQRGPAERSRPVVAEHSSITSLGHSCPHNEKEEQSSTTSLSSGISLERAQNESLAIYLADNPSLSLRPGSVRSYPVTIENLGPKGDDYCFELTTSHDWFQIAIPKHLQLADREKRLFQLEVRVPADVAPGTEAFANLSGQRVDSSEARAALTVNVTVE